MERRASAGGFTLIELLVVVAVMAVLMALLLPALAAAKQRAKGVVCQSRLRQIGVAIFMYEQENQQQFPHASHSTADTSGWLTTLTAYGINAKARGCPEDPRFLNPTINSTSYSTNNYTEPPEPYGKTTLIPRPTRMVFMVESSSGADHVHVTKDQDAFGGPGDFEDAGIAPQRHRGSANYLYVDAHVEVISWATVKATFTPATSFFDPETAR